MKKICSVMFLGIFTFITNGSLFAQEDCVCPASTVINCGHRGTGGNSGGNSFPENTIPSMLQAADEGADMVELDVVHSADGVLVVLHDDTVDNTTDGTGCAGEMTVDELQALDAGYGTSMEGEGIVIPTLAEVLEAIDIDVNIEIKTSGDVCPATDLALVASDIVALINADSKLRTIVVSSFSFEALEAVRALDDNVYIGFVDFGSENVEAAVAAGFDGINFNANMAGADTVEEIHAAGLDANAWTVNLEALMEELLDVGVDMIITDEPDLLAELIVEKCAVFECEEFPADVTAAGTSDDSDDDSGLCSTSLRGNNYQIPILLLLLAIPFVLRKRIHI
jgi:glycerophosphoryl diester phosphodiesterase